MNRVMQRPMFMAKGGESFPDLSGDGKITKKDILMGRGVIPREMQQGGIAAMMPMPMAAPAPEMKVAEVEQMADQQGQMLGGEYLRGMMTGIDSAQTTDELIDAIRGNDRTLQQRYDELASFVGEADASATPESVLTLVQPTLMMTEQGALDTGIGELMQGIAGEVEMETEEGMPTPMGEGIGELMMAQSVPEMQDGGVVQKFQDGQEVMSAQDIFALGLMQGLGAPSGQRIQAQAQQLRPLYETMLGTGEQARDLARLQIFTDIANRGLALASGVNPETGQPMEGNLVSQVAQAAAGAPRVIGAAAANVRAADAQAGQLALQQAISQENLRQQADYQERLRVAGRAPELVRVMSADGSTMLGTFNIADPTERANLDQIQENNPGSMVYKVGVEPVQDFERTVFAVSAQRGSKDFETYQSQARTGGQTLRTLDRVVDSLGAAEEGGFRTGFASDFRLGLVNLADFIGGGVKEEVERLLGDAATAEDFEAATDYLMSEAAENLGRVTNLSLQTLQGAFPRLNRTIGGNKLILQALRDVNSQNVELGQIADYYNKTFGPDGEGVADFMTPTNSPVTDQRREDLRSFGIELAPDRKTMPSMLEIETVLIAEKAPSEAINRLADEVRKFGETGEFSPEFQLQPGELDVFKRFVGALENQTGPVRGASINADDLSQDKLQQQIDAYFARYPEETEVMVIRNGIRRNIQRPGQ